MVIVASYVSARSSIHCGDPVDIAPQFTEKPNAVCIYRFGDQTMWRTISFDDEYRKVALHIFRGPARLVRFKEVFLRVVI